MSPDKLLELVEHFASAKASYAVAHATHDPRAANDFAHEAVTALLKIRAEVEQDHIELRDKRTDLLNVRGILSPNGYEPVTPLSLVPTVAPAVQWLVDELQRLRAALAAVEQAAVTTITQDVVLCHVALIDVSDSLRRLFGSLENASEVYGRAMPAHDFRWHLTAEDGAETTFHRGATADDVAADLRRRAAEHRSDPPETHYGDVVDDSLSALHKGPKDECTVCDATPDIEPCQPIGCDNGYHLAGCRFADIDAAEHSGTEAGQ